jgi:hypothetical protein
MFNIYPRITENSILSLIFIKRTKTIYKTTKKVQCFYAEQQVTNTLIIQNNPNIIITLELPIQSDIRV